MTTSAPRCQMFCSQPLDAAADPVDETGEWKNTCSRCRAQLDHLCREVLPSIRKNGFYAPPAATDDQRLRAMIDQADARPKLREALRFVDDVPTVGGGVLADMWTDPRWPDDGSDR